VKLKLFLLLLLGYTTFAQADNTYTVCFTPGGKCTDEIVQVINAAQKTIYVQAFSFTSTPIFKALADAHDRNVDVRVILDKTDNEPAKFFLTNGISAFVDYVPNIQHNKVMIIDQSVVITGSFNFTYNAQYRNTENVVFLNDHALAALYFKNWISRQDVSMNAKDYFGN
jgi:phosphatidylserine/phosphatidylglycerophosphate/cardiolipin synthase-like enzyme